MINAIHESSHNHNAVKRFLRNYDISQVRHERVLKCFTIGRRISQSEHTDDKINTEIENNINGVCFRRLKHKKVAENAPISIEHPKGSVFGFIDFRGRTHDFYQTFAKETIENDIIREEKNLRRIKSRGKTLKNVCKKVVLKTKKTFKIPEEEKDSFITDMKSSPKKWGFNNKDQLFTPSPKNIFHNPIIKGMISPIILLLETPKIRVKRKIIKSASPKKPLNLESGKEENVSIGNDENYIFSTDDLVYIMNIKIKNKDNPLPSETIIMSAIIARSELSEVRVMFY